jgi:hypothetical protein
MNTKLEKDEIITTLLSRAVAMTKKIIKDMGEFHPICFVYTDDYHNLLVKEIPSSKTEIKDKFLEYIHSHNIEHYAITTNVEVTNEEGVKCDAIEVSYVSDGKRFEDEYIYYAIQDSGEYYFTELFGGYV